MPARIRASDIVWLLFLAALGALMLTEQGPSPLEWIALLGLGAVQVAEGHWGRAASGRVAAAAIAVKLAFCCLLLGVTGGIESSYYLIFLLPIISAASLFRLSPTLVVAAVAGALYLAFLLGVLEGYYVPPDGQRELATRVLFFFVIAVLVNRLATENRLKTERLSQANRELSAAQAEVRRSERLAALGQLSAGLAHEIRNPLGVIQASSELLAKNVAQENAVAREMAGYIGTEVNRTNALVTRFLDFARPAQAHRKVGDLNEVIERAIRQADDASRNAEARVVVQKKLQAIKPFAFDPMLIESAFLNLILNAREAIDEEGEVIVASGRSGNRAWVTVADDGCGIDPEKSEEIFNPFFTTKPFGVGLGLAMVSKFIDSHGGAIAVDSAPGQGTTFRVELPVDQSA